MTRVSPRLSALASSHPPTPILFSGAGTLVNRATITSSTTAFAIGGVSSPNIARFVNEGSIQTGSTTAFAVNAQSGSFSQIVNNGSITAAGGGVSTFQASVINTGTIVATTTAVSIFGNSLTNSGTIRSTTGVGVALNGNVGTPTSNSGRIEGASVGVNTSIDLTNSGTIVATLGNGTAVALDAYGTLINLAGGVVGNGGTAVTASIFNSAVYNAGTINGAVRLSNFSSYSGQRYVSLPGGVLNGNLSLGAGDLFVTDIVNPGPGPFAGVNGTVTAASGALLRYRVSADASGVIGPVGPFQIASSELGNGATLSLTAPATVTQQVQLAGTGTVNLDGTIAASTMPAILTTAVTPVPGTTSAPGQLTINNAGTISVTRGTVGYPGSAVSIGASDSFNNNGTIIVVDRQSNSSTTGISGGRSVTNSGAILLDGGTGVGGSTSFVNTGTITQVAGGATATGVGGVGALDNRGTIQVGGTAVRAYNNGQITNSGTIASTGGIAIAGTDTSASATITNAASGTITGPGGTAVRLYHRSFTNAGTVTGTVDMGYGFPYYPGAPSRSYSSSTYVAAGGTIAGDLLFGDAADLLLQTGDALGVSGAIDGGGGIDIYGRSLTSSGTVAIDPAGIRNFEDGLVQAVGTGTVVTTTATGTFNGNLYAVGTGQVVNEATISGALTTTLPYSFAASYGTAARIFLTSQTLASLTNNASVAGGVSGAVLAFANSGTITSFGSRNPAVLLYSDATLGFTNSGTISQSGTVASYASAVSLSASNGMSISNSGQISGGIRAILYPHNAPSPLSFSFTNSGAITNANGTTASDIGIYGSIGGATILIDNSGTIAARGNAATGGLAHGLRLTVGSTTLPITYAVSNSGTITATSVPSTDAYPSEAVAVDIAGLGLTGTLTNAAAGTINAIGDRATAISAIGSALNVVNAGTISATGTTASVAIRAFDAFDNAVASTGTINGDIVLAAGADQVSNAGAINGTVSLGAGDDRFVQRADGIVTGLVDGGDDSDSYIVDTTGGSTTLAASRIANFERVTQTGTGVGGYSGSFGVDTITLAGGTLSVAAGQTLATAGMTTVTGPAGSGNLSIVNAGTIAGGITLADGDNSVTNTGIITGRVQLGSRRRRRS